MSECNRPECVGLVAHRQHGDGDALMAVREAAANAKTGPTTTIRLVHGRSGPFPRITLWCPDGHEVVDAPLDSRLGQRLNVGNYSGEGCCYGSCGWSA